MHDPIGTGNHLGVVPEETASWEAGAGIEGYVAHGLLNWEGFSSVGGFPNEVFHFGVEHVISAVVPTYVDSPRRSGRCPGEEMAPLIIERVIVYTCDMGRASAHVDVCNINAWRAFELAARNLIG